jgi:predicted dienelactone hydrolase
MNTMKMCRWLVGPLLALGVAWVAPAQATGAPGGLYIDAPELAAPGTHAVGVQSLTMIDRDQLDLGSLDPAKGTAPKRDRTLKVELWYPAQAVPGAKPVVYTDTLDSEPPKPATRFTIQGVAVRDAKPAGGRFPLVIVSHGYGNVPVAMSWITENLASKGYVVAAIRHEDLYFNPAGFPNAALRRPLDIAFVTRELQRTMGGTQGSIDPTRVALVGYSMGGYGVLAAGGATLDPAGGLVGRTPNGLLAPYARGGALSASLVAPDVKAIVAFAPAGGAFGAFGAAGIADIKAPLLLVAGDHDLTVDYTTGARAYFDQAINSNRYLLTFLQGGHALGLGSAPPEMRDDLWNQDWFEDPVWRKERLMAISLHFMTAFLDRYVKDDASRASYIDGLVVESGKGTWDAPQGTPWSARSPGGEVTLWKGFQRRHATGMTLMHAEPAPAK